MKKAGGIIGVVVRWSLGIPCALMAITFFVLMFSQKPVGLFVALGFAFAGGAFLLLRPAKQKQAAQPLADDPPIEPVQFEVPEHILQEMRGAYTVMQAKDDARIMLESFQLVRETTNLDTFLSRLQLCRQKALTLLQAEKAGIKGLKQIGMTDKCNYILTTAPEAKSAFLDRSSFAAITGAFQLKTPAGQRRRLQAYIDALSEHSIDFMDVEHDYNAAIERISSTTP